jgi:hypothetical protein
MDEALLIATVVVGVAALVTAVMLPNHGTPYNETEASSIPSEA